MKKAVLIFLAVYMLSGCAPKTVTVRFDPEVKDYSSIIRAIIDSHPCGNLTIQFEEGIYPMFPESAREDLVFVTNNDSGLKKVAFLFQDKNNISVKGSNTTFLFHGAYVPFVVRNCNNVIISGINIDYDLPFTFEGTVIESDNVGRSFTLAVDPWNSNYSITDGRLEYSGYDWSITLGESIVFDPLTHRPIYNTAVYEHWSKHEMRAEEISSGVIKFTNIFSTEIPPVGSIWVDKGINRQNRLYPGIILTESRNIKVSNVNVYHCGAMSLVGQYCENISLDSFNTILHEGSTRMIASSADATHFVDCTGEISMDGCRFESMLDDATNVHGIYMKLVKKLSDKSFAADFGHYQQYGNVFAVKGERLQFVDKATLQPVGEGIVKSIDKVNENWYEIETDFDLSSYPDNPNLAVKNLDHSVSKVTITNCSVQYNRARSLLISCPGDVLIENNYFASQMAGIHISGDANYWFESGDTQNIIIRNNRFENEGIFCGAPQGVLQVVPVIPVKARGTDFFYHPNIVFEGNQVDIFDNQAIYALNVGTLTIKDNIFRDTKLYEPKYTTLSLIDAQFCGTVTITGNDFSEWKPEATISIHNCLETRIDGCDYPVIDNPNPFFFGS